MKPASPPAPSALTTTASTKAGAGGQMLLDGAILQHHTCKRTGQAQAPGHG